MYDFLYGSPSSIGSRMRAVNSSFSSYTVQDNIREQINGRLKSANLEEVSNLPSSNPGRIMSIPDLNKNVVSSPWSNYNSIGNKTYDSLSNSYLLNQKLRNSGMYTKLKNKTLYSTSEEVRRHAIANSGIL